jgi:hypothetical protein
VPHVVLDELPKHINSAIPLFSKGLIQTETETLVIDGMFVPAQIILSFIPSKT